MATEPAAATVPAVADLTPAVARRVGQVETTKAVDAFLEKLAGQFTDPAAIKASQPDLPDEVVAMMAAATGSLLGTARTLIQRGAHVAEGERTTVKDLDGRTWVVAK